MKKMLLILCTVLLPFLDSAQAPAPLVWGCAANQDSLWAFDTLTWAPVINVPPVVTGSVVNGATGLAFDPTTYQSYAILKINSSRYLAQLSLPSGSCTVMGDLGDNFSSITFDKFGQLYGATGNGATNPETLYKIDKATASSTVMYAMGNGADGEVICYNRSDNKIYHWSGNGTVVYESMPVGATSYAPLNILTSGTTGGETFGALYIGPNDFVISNITGEFKHASNTGVYGNSLSSNPDDIRGMIMPPRFSINTGTVCARTGSLNVFSKSLQQYDSVYYYWGDGSVTQSPAVPAAMGAMTHTYATPGTFILTVKLYNGAATKSTIQTYTITVNTTPLVNITGPANLCPGKTVTLAASGGGSSQWYSGGMAVPGATLNTFTTSATGWFNMVKTNLNGCSDSSATGVQVIAVPAPTVMLTGAIICSGASVTLSPSGASTYTISGGSTVVSPTTTTSYSVSGTSSLGCESGTIAATVTVNPLPTLSVTSSNSTICAGESATLSVNGASLYSWSTSENNNSIVVSPTITLSYMVTGTNSAGCTDTATISQDVAQCLGLSHNGTLASPIFVIPNPGSGRFTFENTPDNVLVEVYDGAGKLIVKEVSSHTGNVAVDISSYCAGIYIARLINNGGETISQIKLIKQ